MLINNLFYEIIQLWIVDWSEKKNRVSLVKSKKLNNCYKRNKLVLYQKVNFYLFFSILDNFWLWKKWVRFTDPSDDMQPPKHENWWQP